MDIFSLRRRAKKPSELPSLTSQLSNLVDVLQKMEENQRRLLEVHEQTLQEHRLYREELQASRLQEHQHASEAFEQLKVANDLRQAAVDQHKVLSGHAIRT